jgi:hypothetical protein
MQIEIANLNYLVKTDQLLPKTSFNHRFCWAYKKFWQNYFVIFL